MTERLRIPGGDVRLWALGGLDVEPPATLESFLIGRTEVTSLYFAHFVAAGFVED